MSSRQSEIHLQLSQLLDALLLGVVFWLSYQLRQSGFIVLDSLWEPPEFNRFLWILAILMPFGPFFLEVQGFYASPLDKTAARTIEQIVRASVWVVLMIAGAAFVFRLVVPSRSVLVVFGLLAPIALFTRDRLFAAVALRRLRHGAAGDPILVAGEPDKIHEFIESLSEVQKLENPVAEVIDLADGDVQELVEALHRHSVRRVVLAFARIELDRVQKVVAACEMEGVEAWLSADFIQTSIARPTYEVFGRKPMLVFRATPEVSWAMMVKWGFDRIGSLALLVLLSPFLLAVAVAIRIGSPGPVIFRQQRAGLYGKPFTMLKFRTMIPGAEDKQRELESLNQMRGPVFKIEDDPRITPIGRFLRKTSIDELPQLLNVLRGHMSLVGPRPLPLYEVAKFEQAGHRRRLSMKPGLTCLWQVRGRNKVSDFDEWVRMDLEYIDNWSLGLDLVIVVRTIPVVLFGWGAK
jgi:exopolysaccharide biosynthesis polyprenyl glycosylphosphotransferase